MKKTSYTIVILFAFLAAFAKDSKSVKYPEDKGEPYFLTNDKDYDKDGISDLEEVQKLQNPFCADSDGDGIPDAKDPNPIVSNKVKQNVHAKIERVGGYPNIVLYKNNKRKVLPMMSFCEGWTANEVSISRAAECGMQVVHLGFDLDEPQNYGNNIKRINWRLKKVLKANPNAYVILWLYTGYTNDFADRFPGDVQRYHDGSNWSSRGPQFKSGPFGSNRIASFASDAFKHYLGGYITKLINSVRSGKYADRVLGLKISSGSTSEWYYLHRWGKIKGVPDYSPAMREAFRNYLRTKYSNDISKLRKAWKSNEKAFDDVHLPSPKVKSKFDSMLVLNPATQQSLIDYWECHNQVLTNHALYYMKVIKTASEGKWLAGLENEIGCRLSNFNGLNKTKQIFRNEHVDFFSAPSAYKNRQPGGIGGIIRYPQTSMLIHNKLIYNENDYRTHLSGIMQSYAGTKTGKETAEAFKVAFGQLLTYGGTGYWGEWEYGSYDDPDITSAFKNMQKIGRFSVKLPRKSVAEIALVYDEESNLITAYDNQRAEALRLSGLPRSGAVYDYLEIDDLLEMKNIPYKMIIFADPVTLTSKERRLIKEKVLNNDRVVVWTALSGVINPDLQSRTAENMNELIGMKLSIHGKKQDLISLTPEGQKLLNTKFDFVCDNIMRESTRIHHKFYMNKRWSYALYGNVEGADVVLGKYKGKAGFGLKKMKDWTSVYVGCNNIDHYVIRGLAELAGVHLYNDNGDALFADNKFLVIHSRENGPVKIKLPEKSYVYEVFDEKEIGNNIDSFIDDIPKFTTKIYYVGSKDELNSNLKLAKEELKLQIARFRKSCNNDATKSSKNYPVSLDKDGIVRDYLYAGPFRKGIEVLDSIKLVDAKSIEKRFKLGQKWALTTDFLESMGGENKAAPVFSSEVIDNGKKLLWKKYSTEGIINNGSDVGIYDNSLMVYFTAFYFKLNEAQKVRLSYAIDDVGVLYCNGVKSNYGKGRKINDNSNIFEAQRGWNRVLLKIYNRGGGHHFAVRITKPDGTPVKCEIGLLPEDKK